MILARYIYKSLISPVLVVVLLCTSIVWLTQSLRFIDLIVSRGVDFAVVLSITMMLLPSFINIILPVAISIGIIFYYHKLISDNEISVMKSTGLSNYQIIKPAIYFATTVTLISYLFSFFISPISNQMFHNKKTFLQHHYAAMVLQERVFTEPIKGLIIYIDQIINNGHFKGIMVSDKRDPNKDVVIMAKEAKVISNNNETIFELFSGNRQEKKKGKVSMVYFDNFPINISNFVKIDDENWLEPEERTIIDLLKEEKIKPEINGKLFSELHNRLSWPLLNLILGSLSAIMLISSKYSRYGYFIRLFQLAVLIAIILVVAILGITLSGRSQSYVVIIYLNILFAILLSLIMLYKAEQV
ncbi:MAG: LptF/LptG family permease [Sphingobacteriia bacterium]|nr:LptF/LptG family permease [Sphingobacteriia bacterium]